MSTIAEERFTNPRPSGKTRRQFIQVTANLDLLMPGQIGEAILANLRGGNTDA